MISTDGDEGADDATSGVIGQRFYQTQFIALGSSGVICEEERWKYENVNRLKRAEQGNNKEQISVAED